MSHGFEFSDGMINHRGHRVKRISRKRHKKLKKKTGRTDVSVDLCLMCLFVANCFWLPLCPLWLNSQLTRPSASS